MKGRKGKGGNMVASKTGKPASNLPGVEVMEEAKKSGGGFKKGGKVSAVSEAGDITPPKAPSKSGGYASGGRANARMDQYKSGGAVNHRGRSPFSAASTQSEPGSGSKCEGY